MGRRAPLLLLAGLFAACGPGACTRPVRVEVCTNVTEEGVCEPPGGGLAAGVGYVLLVQGRKLPGEVEVVVSELPGEGSPREIARTRVRAPAGAEHVGRGILFPEVGAYRVEVRGEGGAVLGARDVDVTIATVRPAPR